MFRGTTPTLEFIFAYNLEDLNIKAFYITIKQGNILIAEKELEDITIEKEKAIIELTQEDTLKISGTTLLSIQARLKIDDKAYATNIITTGASSILKDGVI